MGLIGSSSFEYPDLSSLAVLMGSAVLTLAEVFVLPSSAGCLFSEVLESSHEFSRVFDGVLTLDSSDLERFTFLFDFIDDDFSSLFSVGKDVPYESSLTIYGEHTSSLGT